MILIRKAFCSTNLRKVGIIYSSINVTIRAIALIILIVFTCIFNAEQRYYRSNRSYETHQYYSGGSSISTISSSGSSDDSYYSHKSHIGLVVSMLTTASFFVGLYTILYGLLIYGLSSTKPSILMLWLIFAPFDIINIQAILLYFDYIIIVIAPAGIGIIAMNLHLGITAFMFHNLCVVFTVRHNFIENQNVQNRNLLLPLGNATATATNPLTSPTQNNPTAGYYVASEGSFSYHPTCPQAEARPLI